MSYKMSNIRNIPCEFSKFEQNQLDEFYAVRRADGSTPGVPDKCLTHNRDFRMFRCELCGRYRYGHPKKPTAKYCEMCQITIKLHPDPKTKRRAPRKPRESRYCLPYGRVTTITPDTADADFVRWEPGAGAKPTREWRTEQKIRRTG